MRYSVHIGGHNVPIHTVTHMYTHIHICVHAYKHTHNTQTHTHLYMHTCIHTDTDRHTDRQTQTHIHVYNYIHLNNGVQELYSTVIRDQILAVMVIPAITSIALECCRVKRNSEMSIFKGCAPHNTPTVYTYTYK